MSTSGQMSITKEFVAHDDEQQFVGRKIGKTNAIAIHFRN